MKAIVYIDGFNLYHGRLRHSDYKWLDPVKLFETILAKQDPNIELVQVKFFTARVKARYSRHGQKAVVSQDHYHLALQHLHPERLQIYTGYFSDEPATLIKFKGRKSADIDINHREEVWKIEEKQSDVRLSIEMYRDAMLKNCDLAILCSADSDLVPPLEAIQNDTDVKTAVVLPRRFEADPTKRRPPNRRLTKKMSHQWTREYINEDELANSKLPVRIGRSGKKPIDCPEHWH